MQGNCFNFNSMFPNYYFKLNIEALELMKQFSKQNFQKIHYLMVKYDLNVIIWWSDICLLYTSDAADDMQCVDLGGRRIIKK